MTDSQTTSCCWCGAIHGATCPRVKALEYHPDGTIKRVEFFTPNDYPPLMGRIVSSAGPDIPTAYALGSLQQPLGEPFSTVLYDNLWNLYVRS